MTFDVAWLPSAVDELADLWMKALDRRAVTAAADRIDLILANDPEQLGMAYQDHRLFMLPPLVFTFHVASAARLVTVLQIRRRAFG